jgi:hypothetical protein
MCCCLVPRDYIMDNFNLAQLAPSCGEDFHKIASRAWTRPRSSYPIYKQALQLILQEEPYDPDVTIPIRCNAQPRCCICPPTIRCQRGLDTVTTPFLLKTIISGPHLWTCLRVVCQGMPLLPFENQTLQVHEGGRDTRAKRYCPSW